MLKLLRQALQLLDTRGVLRVYQLLTLSIVTAIIEVLGIGSIAPFIAVLTNPELVDTNPHLNLVYIRLGFDDPYTFLSLLAGIVVALALLRNVLFMIYQWLNSLYLSLFKHHLSSRLLTAYLAQPYNYYLNRNTVELQRNVVEETNRVIEGVLRPIISALTQLIICTAIAAFLIFIRPVVALVTLTVLGGFYAIIYSLVNKRLKTLSAKRREYRSRRFKLASEALSGIKPLILSGQQRGYADEFEKTSRKNAIAEAKGQAIATIPRYGIESIAIVGLILFTLYEIIVNQRGMMVLPLMSLYLLAGYRLLPALQKLYSGLSKIKFDSASFEVVYEHLTTLNGDLQPKAADDGFRLQSEIELNDVTYSYPNESTPTISDIYLTIEAKQSIAFVGKSGAGKSTLVDLILGMLETEHGEIRIDGRDLDEVKASWQGQIGYVPQHIYLSDDTVARNIAFGVDQAEIDQDALVRAAKIADVHNHVVTQLRLGYDTLIGERGIRLSGGQRQRIGIARAMYRNPSILVLDEATSALDGATENVVMEAIQRLSNDITIILIAHRTTTVQFCDKIFVLSDGRIVDEGDYSKLSTDSTAFRALSDLPEFQSTGGSSK